MGGILFSYFYRKMLRENVYIYIYKIKIKRALFGAEHGAVNGQFLRSMPSLYSLEGCDDVFAQVG